MPSRSLPGPADQVSRAIVVGFGATLVLLLVYLVAYGLAQLFAVAAPGGSLSHRLISGWLQALSHSRLTDPAQPFLYAAVGVQITIGLAGAIVYATLAEARLGGPPGLRGFLFALSAWLFTMVVVLPVLGAGPLGAALGAGPLPAYTTLLGYIAYGVVLALAYAAREDVVVVSGVTPNQADTSGWGHTAVGLAAGAVLGGALGLVFGALVPWQGQVLSGGLMPVALMMSFALAGGAVGELVGSLSALPTAPATLAAVLAPSAPLRLPTVEPEAAGVALNGRRLLRVVAAHGTCQLGYQPGQTFRCSHSGELEPGVCPAAQEALRPLLRALAEGRSDAPQRVACPIYDHMLVFEAVTQAA